MNLLPLLIAVAQPAVDASAVTWTARPSAEDIRRVYPKAAAESGVSGQALLRCMLGGDGKVARCDVLEETPARCGFGEAALRLGRLFAARTTLPDGSRVAGAMERLPISFTSATPPVVGGATCAGPAGAAEAATAVRAVPVAEPHGEVRADAVIGPAWAEAPSPAEVAAAAPADRSGAGYAVMGCQVRGDGKLGFCRLHRSYGEADDRVLRLAARFTLAAPPSPAARGLREVTLSVRFPAPGEAPSPIRSARWIAQPDAASLKTLFPAAAQAAGANSGVGVVDCLVAPGGALGDCRVARESPEGLGFGQAALKAAAGLRISAWTEQGEPTAGRRVTVPLRFARGEATP